MDGALKSGKPEELRSIRPKEEIAEELQIFFQASGGKRWAWRGRRSDLEGFGHYFAHAWKPLQGLEPESRICISEDQSHTMDEE